MRPLLALAYIILSSMVRFVWRNLREIAIAVVCYFGVRQALSLQSPAIRNIVALYFVIEALKAIKGGRKIDRGNLPAGGE